MVKRLNLFLLFLSITTVSAQDSVRIFWFGHSLSGSGVAWRSTEFLFFAQEQNIPMYFRLINSGANYNQEIKQSWTATGCKDTIALGNWDFVAWNDLYTYVWDAPRDTFLKYTRLYIDLVDSVGAIPVIFEDWHLDARAYVVEACRTYGAYLAPVFSAHEWVSTRYPDIHYTVDGAHADAPLGYLAGVTCWIAFFGQRPFGFGNVYPTLDSSEAHLMRQVAWNAVVDTPYIDLANWPLGVKPRLVKQITFDPSTDTLDQLVSKQLLIRTVYENDSAEGPTNWAIFRSLTPTLANVSHSGMVFTKNPGVAQIEALREKQRDTLDLVVRASLPAPDSLRISPHSVPGYVNDGYQFSATGYFTVTGSPVVLDVTDGVNWSGVDSVFTVVNGKIQRKTGQAGGGAMFVAVELYGAVDTVRFTMAPELALLRRINFQDRDTVYNQDWQADWGRPTGDTAGFWWEEDGQYFEKAADDQGIRYSERNFLTHSLVRPRNSSGQGIWSTFTIEGPDNWYILKAVMGDYRNAAVPCSLVHLNDLSGVFDTLVAFTGTPGNLLTTVVDTIEVHGMDGIHLHVFGPIEYLVVCSMEGVDIDSIALDGDEYITGVPVRNKITLVDFGASAAQNVYGIPGWDIPFMDRYCAYSNAGPAGVFGNSNYTYNYAGVAGSAPYTFNAGDTIEIRWYNNISKTLAFAPNISFTDSGRYTANPAEWYSLDSISIAPYEFGVSRFVLTAAHAGSHSLVSVAPRYGDVTQGELLYDKIELIPYIPGSETEPVAEQAFSLFSAYPNPFNPAVTLLVGRVSNLVPEVTVMDIRGKVVRRLKPQGVRPGAFEYVWDGKTSGGGAVASGVYVFPVRVGNKVFNVRATLLK